MAFIYQVLRVIVLGVIAAAVDDIPVTWSQTPHTAFLPCTVAGLWRVHFRRPPLPIDDDRARIRPFMWRKGQDEIKPKWVSQNGTLEVRRQNGGGSEGVYQCLVRHHDHVLGYPVNLKFSYLDVKFSKQPEDVTARLGQPLSIPCKIGSGPSAIITWTRDNVELPKNDRYYFLDNELLIIDVQKEDAGAYRCTASNVNANRTRTSHEGQVSVVESSAEEPSLLPIEHIHHIAVPRESKVVLPCPVLGWPRPKLIWELNPPGERPSELEFAQEVLVLPKVEYDQEGLYTCLVEGHSHLHKIFNVTITEPVKIILPPFSKEVMRASTVRFNCTATGRPAPNVTWYKDGSPLELAGRFNLRNSVDHTRIELVISGVTSDDAGIYQCLAQNGISMASEWARLNVTGAGAAAPAAVQCAPTGVSSVELRWEPAADDVMAYTVDITPLDKRGVITGQPHKNTVEILKVRQPLTPYIFQVRAYISSSPKKNIASDMSESVICQGQGVPIKLTELEDDQVLVSWQTFAEQTPGVVQWILQYKSDLHNGSYGDEHNITLEAKVTNYTLTAPESSPLLVRLLGSRSLEWLPQNLTLVPWVSTNAAGQEDEDGVMNLVPQDLEVTDISARSFTLKWSCEDASDYNNFIVCWKKIDENEDCQESYKTTATIEGLQPETEYEVRVQVRLPNILLGGAFSAPYRITTQPEGPHRFKDLTYKFINETTLRVSWSGAPATYTVHHSAELKLPVEQWATVNTTGNTVVITNIDPIKQTFVMVIGYNPTEYSPILNVPSPVKELEPKDLKYVYTSSGVCVWWHGPGVRTVRYAQNITQPLDNWNSVNVSEPKIELNNLDASLPLYVMVTPAGGGRRQHVLTIPPRPPGLVDDHYYHYIGIGVGCGACALCALAAAAICIWKRMKANRSPDRSRRHIATSEGAEEEGSEMKVVRGVRGARVANGDATGGVGAGGAGGAGEPLLNGHVHITENPVSKTPNGRIKKGRRYEPQAFEAFDVSRNDHDTTIETVLEDTTYSLLDTSRRPEYDCSRSSQNLTTNNSFNKLPDDNMNSELTRSTFQLDNSKIQPTLQPNG